MLLQGHILKLDFTVCVVPKPHLLLDNHLQSYQLLGYLARFLGNRDWF